ncbi:MAG TPA: S9 family peptidase [Candidatus Limnocylindria bacterium]|nr:S9 family peptidase [Candidatus Limnocylindria bacterium]
MKALVPAFATGLMMTNLLAQVPDNLVVEGVPAFPPELRAEAARYMEFRAAAFNSWHPKEREMLITTRFAESMQLHQVKSPGAARKQLTFLPEPVAGGKFQPKRGECIVFSQDTGGGEFYQLYRYDLVDGRITLLTDGKSRNTGAHWARSGKWMAYTSTKRNGKDNDLWIIEPFKPDSAKLVREVSGGGWSVVDCAPDDEALLVREYISINESRIHLFDVRSGAIAPITPAGEKQVAYGSARFSGSGKTIFVTTDKDAEFQRLVEMDFNGKVLRVLTEKLKWDVDEFELSPDGKTIAYISNEDGVGVLHLLDAKSGKEIKTPKLPLGIPSGLEWHENGRDLGFNFVSAKSPTDAYSVDVKTGKVERWTESETGGLDPQQFVEPELVKLKSFDGLQISAFVYRPDAKKFPGKRPVIVNIHGGPESQSRPIFQARINFYLNELGIAVIYPNVRGSAGYGKTFVALDNGFKREDSVKDIAAVLDFIKHDAALDGGRIAVSGGSYGGYMSLACMQHYADSLRCGIDVVGISNFLTFLKNTQDYRRDLRRAEYGDERDPKMAEFLEKISPTTNVKKISKPLFVVQGKNDPRVPVTESEQMVKAIRNNGGTVWYLMAKDEGHGFAKKRNVDYQFLATIQFYREFLLK